MNSSLTSSYTPPQATFVGKTRAFEPVEKTIVDYPLTIDVEPIDAASKDKPDETRFTPSYDNQQRLANLTYSSAGDFVRRPQNVIEAEVNRSGVSTQDESTALSPVQAVDRASNVSSQQAINAFNFIAKSDNGAGAAGVNNVGVDIFA